MKNITYYLVLLIVLFVSCSDSKWYWNNNKLNPNVKDEYGDIAGFKYYKQWGGHNVHDPSCMKTGKYYYAYSTDAIWIRDHKDIDTSVKIGNIQVRRSTDLVHWDFVGWVFPSIPQELLNAVTQSSGGKKPNGIWAPYITKSENEYRLYFCASLFGENTSCIALAVADSPEGPWKMRGTVVQTTKADSMNAIDPTVIRDDANGKVWMIYGSYFAGLYCVELDLATGLAKIKGDKGKVVARRANGKERVVEAPEVVYNPALKKYFLFVSYDALFTHYNVRVGRADKPEGPYFDFFGRNMADTTNNYPILTYAYRFSGHPGWAGVGHCSVIKDEDNYFMLHQGRLAPDNQQMVMHVRRIVWTGDGWPVVSPERYAAMPSVKIKSIDMAGNWELITLDEIVDSVKLWQGQIPWGGWKYDTAMFNNPKMIGFTLDGNLENSSYQHWNLSGDNVLLTTTNGDSLQLKVFPEWDWENAKPTIVMTGLDKRGHSVWAKKNY